MCGAMGGSWKMFFKSECFRFKQLFKVWVFVLHVAVMRHVLLILLVLYSNGVVYLFIFCVWLYCLLDI